MSGPLRVLIINPSGEEVRGVVGKVCEDKGCVIDEVSTKECVDLFVSCPPVPTLRVVDDLPPSSRGYDFLYILGGPLGVLTVPPGAEEDQTPPKTVQQVERLIRDFHGVGKPVLGCCLGGQLIARTFGGKVQKLPKDAAHGAVPGKLVDVKPEGFEWGWLEQKFTQEAESDPIIGPALDAMRSKSGKDSRDFPLNFCQWHSDCFTYPPAAVELSTRSTCSAQAFRMGETTYGFQYHIEVDQALSETWLKDYCSGADSYVEEEKWEGLSESDQKALKAEHEATIANGTIARAEVFTRTVTLNLLAKASRVREDRAAVLRKKVLFVGAFLVAGVACLVAARHKLR